MLIEGNIDGKLYEKLVEYAFQKCNEVSLTKYYDQNIEKHSEVMNIILSTGGYTINDIITNYSDLYLNSIYIKFKNNKNIFDDEYIEKYENNSYAIDYKCFKKLKEKNRKEIICSSINRLVYNELTNLWLIKNNKNVLLEKDNLLDTKIHSGEKIIHSKTYYFKNNEDIKDELLNKKSIYSWCYPKNLEDISFFKDGYCWLYSVAHEELCIIYCENEKEYEYLKSIGIEFVDKVYKEIDKEELYYEKY